MPLWGLGMLVCGKRREWKKDGQEDLLSGKTAGSPELDGRFDAGIATAGAEGGIGTGGR